MTVPTEMPGGRSSDGPFWSLRYGAAMVFGAPNFARAEWVLRIGVAIQCIGAAWSALVKGTALGSTLFVTWGWSEGASNGVVSAIAYLTLAAGLCALIPGRSKLSQFVLWGLGGIFFVESICTAYQRGNFGAEFAPLARSIRFITPWVLAFWWKSDGQANSLKLVRLLTLSIGGVFIFHGIEALLLHPRFIDYLILVPEKVVGLQLSQSQVEFLLYGIGIVDIFVAIWAIRKPSAFPLLYMALWGLLTASIRSIYYGPAGSHATLIRALNGLAPLAIYGAHFFLSVPKREMNHETCSA